MSHDGFHEGQNEHSFALHQLHAVDVGVRIAPDEAVLAVASLGVHLEGN
jgi:hypothetical protein